MDFKAYLISIGIAEDVATKAVEGMKENKFFLSQEEHIDDRYNKLKAQKEAADEQLKTATQTIESLKTSNTSNEDLQGVIKQHEETIQTLKDQNQVTQKQSAIDLSLIKHGARNPKAVAALLDAKKIELSEDGIKGIDEQLEALKTSDAYLFQSEEKPDTKPRILNEENPNGAKGSEKDAFDSVLDKY